MNFSQPYNEMVSRMTVRSFQEGSRPYPVVGTEIFLLDMACQRARRNFPTPTGCSPAIESEPMRINQGDLTYFLTIAGERR